MNETDTGSRLTGTWLLETLKLRIPQPKNEFKFSVGELGSFSSHVFNFVENEK